MNLLDPPSAMRDPDIAGRVFTVWEDRDNRPAEAPLGPGRAEMLDSLGIPEVA